LDKTGVIKCN